MQDTIVTQPAETQGLRHDPTTITLHWISALLVAVLWTIGQTVDVFPNGPLRIDYRSVHIVLGVALGVVLLARLAWRLMRHQTLPPIDHGLLLVIARITHWLLYAAADHRGRPGHRQFLGARRRDLQCVSSAGL